MSDRIVLTDELIQQTLLARAATAGPVDEITDEIVRAMTGIAQERRARLRQIGLPARLVAAATVALAAVLGVALVVQPAAPAVKLLQVGAGGVIGPLLDAGRYRSTRFLPTLTFAVPGDVWAASVDLPAEVELRAVRAGQPVDQSAVVTIVRIDSVMAGGCGYDGSASRPVGSDDPAAFMRWLAGQLPANLGPERPVTIGGRPGLERDLQPSTDLKQTCDFGFLVTDVGTTASPRIVEIPIDGRPVRIAAMVVSGKLVMIVSAKPWTAQFGDASSDINALLGSMTFE